LNRQLLDGVPTVEKPALLSLADVHCEEKLSGLLTHYSWCAAVPHSAQPSAAEILRAVRELGAAFVANHTLP
jgi:hypothetical protein